MKGTWKQAILKALSLDGRTLMHCLKHYSLSLCSRSPVPGGSEINFSIVVGHTDHLQGLSQHY